MYVITCREIWPVSYCINPRCAQRQNPEDETHCLTCGTPLLVEGRYRLLRPLRELDEWEPTEVFEVADLKPVVTAPGAEGRAEPRPNKVLKVLKKSILLPLFEREATTLQQLNHPGIPQVESDAYFSVPLPGQSSDSFDRVQSKRALHCLVMENIQGSNLDSWLQEHEPINQATALDWLGQLVSLLKQLHATELFHRDIKLSNIMLRPTGELALIDFGTVRPLSNTYFAKIASQRDITSVMSPGYTPLEQVNGRAVPQSDFYALGRSFVHLLTGQHPLDLPEDNTSGLLTWQDQAAQPLSPGFAQLLDEMMAPFPGQRPLNAQLLQARLTNAVLLPATGKDLVASDRLGRPGLRRLAIATNLVLLLIHLFVAGQWFVARQLALEPARTSSLLPR